MTNITIELRDLFHALEWEISLVFYPWYFFMDVCMFGLQIIIEIIYCIAMPKPKKGFNLFANDFFILYANDK